MKKEIYIDTHKGFDIHLSLDTDEYYTRFYTLIDNLRMGFHHYNHVTESIDDIDFDSPINEEVFIEGYKVKDLKLDYKKLREEGSLIGYVQEYNNDGYIDINSFYAKVKIKYKSKNKNNHYYVQIGNNLSYEIIEFNDDTFYNTEYVNEIKSLAENAKKIIELDKKRDVLMEINNKIIENIRSKQFRKHYKG